MTNGWSDVEAGDRFSCARSPAGAVKCWGNDQFGQLGNGAAGGGAVPVQVTGLSSGVQALSVYYDHACAINASGGAVCWGRNNLGQIGDGTTGTDRAQPVAVSGAGSGVTAITAGRSHSCMIAAGVTKCWGSNSAGALGNGTFDESLTPVAVVGLGVVSALSAGSHTCALSAGLATCWGDNEFGQGGDGYAGYTTTPVAVMGPSNFQSVSGGVLHTCGRTLSGAARCWGSNGGGPLGNPTFELTNVSVAVMGLTSGVQTVTAGQNHSCALLDTGGLKCWGQNFAGQLGTGNNVASDTPSDVPGLTSGVLAVVAAQYHTCAIVTGGSVLCWGQNGSGQLGNGSTVNATSPQQVSGLTSGALSIDTEGFHTCARLAAEVKCWGDNTYGQLGDGSTTRRTTPVTVPGLPPGVTSLTAGQYHTCAVVPGGEAKCWGNGSLGRLGNGATTNQATPVDVAGLTSGVASVAAGDSHTCAAMVAGGTKCWGSNGNGQLGNGTRSASSVPVDVAGLSVGQQKLSGGTSFTCAVTTGVGTHCWGRRYSGQLGDGRYGFNLAPTAVQASQAPWPPTVDLQVNGTTGEVYNGLAAALGGSSFGLRGPGPLPESVSAVFWWNNPNQRFDFWFRGFPQSFQTLASLAPGQFYFYQSTGAGAVGNVGGGATLAEPGTASIGPTVAGANGAVWAGTTHDLAALGGYAAIQPATAVFWWDNAGQQFRFWFRGFPDAFQTLAGGLERGKFYFFQAPANANIPMN